jgi:hypothetical protein
MKKHSPNPPDSATESPDLSDLSKTTERTISTRLRNPTHPSPISHVFTILPDVDTPTLLAHACETLASLNVMTTDLACDLEGSRRNVALAMQQLAVVAELLVNRALDNLDPPDGSSEAQSASHS